MFESTVRDERQSSESRDLAGRTADPRIRGMGSRLSPDPVISRPRSPFGAYELIYIDRVLVAGSRAWNRRQA